MDKNAPERLLVIASRLADRYQLTDSGIKNLQHVFTSWFPRVVYFDLTDDTVRVNVVVRRGVISAKNVFSTAFISADGSVLKTVDYDEDRMVGKVCDQYDQRKTGYYGKKDSFDFRLVSFCDPAERTAS